LQTFATLYATWVERLRSEPKKETRGALIRRLVRVLLLDVALLAAIVIGVSVAQERLAGLVEQTLGLDASIARLLIIAAAFALALPLTAGIARTARRLGLTIAEAALPPAAAGKVDLAAAPRRALILTLQIAIILLMGVPLLALTQPFLGGIHGPILLALLLLAVGVAFWRSAANLQGHVRAGAETIVEVLTAQARKGSVAVSAHASGEPADALVQVRHILPGLGEPVAVRLEDKAPAVGKTLADLNLRGVTGATVLAITRGDQGVLVPTAQEVLQAGDILALAGTQEAILAAKAILGAEV
jgi:CPA2 family monovalent cation:H+ antiporter-2